MPEPERPSAVTRPQSARLAITQVRHVGVKIEELEWVQFVEEANDDAPMKWKEPVGEEEGEPVYPTYGEERARLQGVVARVWERAEKQGMDKLMRAMIAADAAQAEAQAVVQEELQDGDEGDGTDRSPEGDV